MNNRQRVFILTISLLSLSGVLYSQDNIAYYQSFAIDHKEVIWVQVYHHADSVEELAGRVFEHFSRKVWITRLRYEGEDILAELVDYRPDYKRYGGKYLNTSTVVRNGKWDGKVRISFKEGKYRVILEGLHYRAWQPSTGSGKATIEKHPVSGTLSQWALDDYRMSFRKNRMNNLDILHLSFKDSFMLTFNQLIDSDW